MCLLDLRSRPISVTFTTSTEIFHLNYGMPPSKPLCVSSLTWDANMVIKENPLLFSCRSGAAVSMPGMMDTVLNIGLNSETVEGLAKTTGNARFAWDAFRRLLDMYGQVVLEIPHHAFEDRLKAIKAASGCR